MMGNPFLKSQPIPFKQCTVRQSENSDLTELFTPDKAGLMGVFIYVLK